MNTEDKFKWMFKEVYGDISDRFDIDVICDEDDIECCIDVKKNGNICWSVDKCTLVFKYLTKHLD